VALPQEHSWTRGKIAEDNLVPGLEKIRAKRQEQEEEKRKAKPASSEAAPEAFLDLEPLSLDLHQLPSSQLLRSFAVPLHLRQ
jgi:hypothetical protein